jgi:hypothetical protein
VRVRDVGSEIRHRLRSATAQVGREARTAARLASRQDVLSAVAIVVAALSWWGVRAAKAHGDDEETEW